MALVTETPDSDLQATERTRKIAFWVVSAIIALFVLWWSFDLLQLWIKQGEELSSKQQELTSITVENAELEEKARCLVLSRKDRTVSPTKLWICSTRRRGLRSPTAST